MEERLAPKFNEVMDANGSIAAIRWQLCRIQVGEEWLAGCCSAV
jgi:hypothetical protein